MSDNDMVLRFMREFGYITQKEAVRTLNCYRLSARIHDLRRRGHNIITERVPFHKGDHWSTYARYWLKEEQDG